MTYTQLTLTKQLAHLKAMRDAGERWTSYLQSTVKTHDDAVFLMQQQKRLSIINQQYRDTLHKLDTYKKKNQIK